uniref:Uncharacterized protein MANES_09G047800 n=1 Tax=Rhizophora mucronata TaxID=61149 RepID=A0A2P2LM61_RHIMU
MEQRHAKKVAFLMGGLLPVGQDKDTGLK